MLIQLFKTVIPIFTALFAGIFCRNKNIVDKNGNQNINQLLMNFILPIMLFNSFLFADYSSSSLIYILVIFFVHILLYKIALVVKRYYNNDYKEYFAESITSWEGGTLGISLCSLLFGSFGIQTMAVFDLGQAFFLFGIIVPILKKKDGNNGSLKDLFKLLFSTKTFMAILLGALCGIFGLSKVIISHDVVNVIYHGIVDIIVAPTNFLILFTIGYEINVDKTLIKPILTASIIRLLLMTLGLLISAFVIFKFVPFDKRVLYCLIIAFSLPSSYALPIFSNFGGKKEFISNLISFMTLITLVIFIIVSIFVNS